jgi:hypothetical protein
MLTGGACGEVFVVEGHLLQITNWVPLWVSPLTSEPGRYNSPKYSNIFQGHKRNFW